MYHLINEGLPYRAERGRKEGGRRAGEREEGGKREREGGKLMLMASAGAIAPYFQISNVAGRGAGVLHGHVEWRAVGSEILFLFTFVLSEILFRVIFVVHSVVGLIIS